jgi:hypothetical protein
MKKSTPAGVAGNVARDYVPDRMWNSCSYGTDRRAVSSLAGHDTTGSPSTTHVKGPRDGREQIPTAFREIDRRRCQDATPVRDRPHTRVVE